MISTLKHFNIVATTLDHHDMLNRRRSRASLVGGWLEREDGSSAVAAISSDQHPGISIGDPIGECLR